MVFKNLKRIALFVVMLAVLAGAAVFASTRATSASVRSAMPTEFMIVNQTEWTFTHLYISPSRSRKWGPDQLGARRVIAPGGSFTINNIPCGLYDVKVIDHDGDECVVQEVPMCRTHTHWEVTNELLASCEGY
ncbi:MAG: hypothetical protein ABIP75_15540 [Pyrinomonadaceae bacterium]